MNELKKLLKKQSIKNGIWMYLLQFFNAVVPLLTLPYITRILGSSQYGVFSVALNIVNYLQVLVEYGFGMSATRKVALNLDRNKINKLFSSVILSRLFLLLVSVFFAVIYILLNRNSIDLCFSLLALLICLVGYCVQVNWLFQGLQEMKFISIVNIVARSISVIGIFIFVKNRKDLLLYCVLYAVSPFLSGIIGLCVALFKYNLKFVRCSLIDIRNELRDGFYVFTTQLSSKVFGAIGITFLGVFAAASEVGIFSAIQKLPNILILAWTPIAQVLYPIASQHMKASWNEGKSFVYRIRKIVLPCFIGGVFLIAIASKWIILFLFGEEYQSYFYWAIPLLSWMILAINNNFLGVQILLSSGHDIEYSKCFQIGVACTVLFNLILISLWHGNGASIAPVLSEIVLGILLANEIKKISKNATLQRSKDYEKSLPDE